MIGTRARHLADSFHADKRLRQAGSVILSLTPCSPHLFLPDAVIAFICCCYYSAAFTRFSAVHLPARRSIKHIYTVDRSRWFFGRFSLDPSGGLVRSATRDERHYRRARGFRWVLTDRRTVVFFVLPRWVLTDHCTVVFFPPVSDIVLPSDRHWLGLCIIITNILGR